MSLEKVGYTYTCVYIDLVYVFINLTVPFPSLFAAIDAALTLAEAFFFGVVNFFLYQIEIIINRSSV